LGKRWGGEGVNNHNIDTLPVDTLFSLRDGTVGKKKERGREGGG